jgi:o-succinylbenzoate synthase
MNAAIREVAIKPYRLRLRRPWQTAREVTSGRSGLLIAITAEHSTGYGDCAPMPVMGTESLTQARAWLEDRLHRLTGTSVDAALASLHPPQTHAAAARCGMETALLDLASQLYELPLRRYIASEADDSVAVNYALGALDEQPATDALRDACGSGFRVLKVKLGMAPAATELARLRRLTERLPPGCRLRLDANGAWDMATASDMLERLNGLPVEAVEEPLDHPDAESLRRLQAGTAIPLALDESLGPHNLDAIIERQAVRRLVLKPALLGGLLPARDIALRAQGAGVEVVLTSLLESSAGLWPTAQLAAALFPTPGTPPHGLATGDWMEEDVGQPPPIRAARIQLGERPGSGFVADDRWRP